MNTNTKIICSQLKIYKPKPKRFNYYTSKQLRYNNSIEKCPFEIAKKGEKPTRRDAKFVHHYDNDYELPIYFESAGTKRMLELTLPLIELANSSVLMIDEIESSLHQSLLETFLQLFLEISDDSQLLFTTHNLDLLDSDLLRDDEVWFCFKTDKGNSIYNSITDYKGIRKEASRKKLYMADKFGALPIIDMQKLKGLFNAKKN